MEPSFDRNVVKCPECKSNINISVGRYPGGCNDSGGWVLKCATCNEEFPVPVKNPDDLSSVISGASVVASWDNEIGSKAEVLAEQLTRTLLTEATRQTDGRSGRAGDCRHNRHELPIQSGADCHCLFIFKVVQHA